MAELIREQILFEAAVDEGPRDWLRKGALATTLAASPLAGQEVEHPQHTGAGYGRKMPGGDRMYQGPTLPKWSYGDEDYFREVMDRKKAQSEREAHKKEFGNLKLRGLQGPKDVQDLGLGRAGNIEVHMDTQKMQQDAKQREKAAKDLLRPFKGFEDYVRPSSPYRAKKDPRLQGPPSKDPNLFRHLEEYPPEQYSPPRGAPNPRPGLRKRTGRWQGPPDLRHLEPNPPKVTDKPRLRLRK